MATILPGSPPSFNKENVGGTVRAICGYLRTLHDNVDYQLGLLKKAQADQEKAISELEKKVAALEGNLKTAQGKIETLENNYNNLSARVAALEG